MKSRRELLITGDRVLIRPDDAQGRTESGLYLPDGVKEKEKAGGGTIVKSGPGYLVPELPGSTDYPWQGSVRGPKYVPIDVAEGDYAIFIRSDAVEVEYEGKKYLIVPYRSILALVRTKLVTTD